MQKKQGKNRGKESESVLSGIIKVNSRGVGYVAKEGIRDDIEIESYFLKGALDNDKVLISIHPPKKNDRQKGEVIKILERAKEQFTGVVEKDGEIFFLKADDRRMYRDIIIPPNPQLKKLTGQKVLVKITNWGNQKKNPEGKIVKVFGPKGEHEAEIQSIIFNKGFESSFSEAVEEEARKVAEVAKINFEDEVRKRKDIRGIPTFTIDPVDAKDFDDAISLREIKDPKFKGVIYEIGIHIADVSYYVTEGSSLDTESKKRGFSIYLVDRTIPMLPEVLSNNLCSLNPNENKLAFSAIFKISESGKVLDRFFGRTIISSQKRFTYEETQKILDDKNGIFFKELNILNNLAKTLKKERFKMGAIDFDTDEIKFELDKNGRPIRVFKKPRMDTNKLVEEMMLLANREVAEFVHRKAKSKSGDNGFIFRIHDLPNREKIKSLSIFLRALGYSLPFNDRTGVSSKDLNALFAKIEGRAEESLIKTAAVRAMAKAVYSVKNIGHFGLAFQYYTHFTSPIRRYPDLLVHRFLDKCLAGKIDSVDFEKYRRLSEELSEKEIQVTEAERESIKFKQVEYMAQRIGENFEGIISGITEWGIYVEEKNTRSEGMIKLRDIGDDFYQLDEKQYALIGQKTKRKFQLADKIRFKIKRVDLDSKQIDYEPI